MVKAIHAECYKLARRPYFYITCALCALCALGVILCLFWVKMEQTGSDAALINLPLALNFLLFGIPIGSYLVLLGGDMAFSEQYKVNTLKNEVSYGLSRASSYLSRWVTAFLAMAVMYVVLVLVYLVSGALLLGVPENGAWTVSDGLAMFGLYSLAALPLWLGALSLMMACLFLARSSNMAAVFFLIIFNGVSAVLDKLGVYIHPFFTGFYHLTLNHAMDFLMSAQTVDWALIGRCAVVGLAWTAVTTAVGLWCFARREIS